MTSSHHYRTKILTVLTFALLGMAPLHADLGDISTVAGTGGTLHTPENVPGPATSNGLADPTAVAFDTNANAFYLIAGNLVRRVDVPTGTLTAFAGTGAPDYTGDGGQATAATFDNPQGLAVDGDGNVFVADTFNGVVRKIDIVTGIITTIAGTGVNGTTGADGDPATSSQLNNPVGLAFDLDGDLLIGTFDVIRKVDISEGTIFTIAGTGGDPGYSGDGGLAVNAKLRFAKDIAVVFDGDIVFTDHLSHVIRRIDSITGNITTIAGNGMAGFAGDDMDAGSSQIDEPNGIAVDLSGNIYFADRNNERIRKINSTTNIITTIAGNGNTGFAGDGGSALLAEFNSPLGIAPSNNQTLYVADYANNRIRAIEGVGTFLPIFRPDNLIGPKFSKLKGNNIYGGPGGQKSREKITKGRRAKIFYIIQNDGNTDDQYRLRVNKGRRKFFKPKWIAGGRNITAAIQTGNYVTPSVPEGGSFLVKGKIKLKTDRKKNVYRFSCSSVSNGSKRDSAIGLIKVKK
ncbi:MAG: hypothetical protein CMO55_06420 [Verrucomicrobiales bacterium]|nr:hypothetical protein [Verrucomicrobiales bacterium]